MNEETDKILTRLVEAVEKLSEVQERILEQMEKMDEQARSDHKLRLYR